MLSAYTAVSNNLYVLFIIYLLDMFILRNTLRNEKVMSLPICVLTVFVMFRVVSSFWSKPTHYSEPKWRHSHLHTVLCYSKYSIKWQTDSIYIYIYILIEIIIAANVHIWWLCNKPLFLSWRPLFWVWHWSVYNGSSSGSGSGSGVTRYIIYPISIL